MLGSEDMNMNMKLDLKSKRNNKEMKVTTDMAIHKCLGIRK